MNYNETIEYLYGTLPVYHRIGKAAYKNNLENTLLLDEIFGHPHRNYRTVHVAGTNGKGSVSHMLASALQEGGYKTGLYTSPHLKDFRERIRIDGEMIPEESVVSFVRNHRPMIEKIKPSFFELTVAMAFQYFSQAGVDIAVIETGLGGRLDSTNILSPVLSVITNIGWDHTNLLGDTLPSIAREKAGIIKNGIPVVVGEKDPNTEEVFRSTAQEYRAPISFAEDVYKVVKEEWITEGVKYAVEDVRNRTEHTFVLDLKGTYQRKNLVTVLASLDMLKKTIPLSFDAIRDGLASVEKNTGLAGRWQILQRNPLVVADTAHNEAGIKMVTEQIKNQRYNKLYVVFGVVNDKDLTKILPLLPTEAYYFFTRPSIDRAMNAEVLFSAAAGYGLKGEIVPEVKEALTLARERAGEEDVIFVGGSTFTVAEVI